MDTQRMADATKFHRLAVTLTFDPTADDSERWIACIGFDAYGAGSTPDEALDAAMNREALGPEPQPAPDVSDQNPSAFGFVALDLSR
jgi:hypothetical protein